LKLITHTNSDSNNPSKAIIALHGWTGDEFVFEPVAKMLKIDSAQWFFPRAPYKAEKKEGIHGLVEMMKKAGTTIKP
jgi:predicted esterase